MRIAPYGFIHSIGYGPAHKEVVRKGSGIDQGGKYKRAKGFRQAWAVDYSTVNRLELPHPRQCCRGNKSVSCEG